MKRLVDAVLLLATVAFMVLALMVNARAVDFGTFVGDPSPGVDGTFRAVASAVGQTPTAMDTYIEFKNGPDGWGESANYGAGVISGFNARNGTNVMPVVGLPMASSKDTALAEFQALASGANDAQLKAIFDAYAAKGFKAIDIRPGWEMNGDWYAWSVNPGNAAAFKAAFQHITEVAHAYQGMLVSVTWNPGYVPNSGTPYMSYFPGAQYVDSIGIDTYGKGSGMPSTAPLDNTTDPNTYTLKDAIALAQQTGRPLALPETGAAAGDTEFPKNLADVITASGVEVSYVTLWDEVSGGMSNLQWTGDPGSEAAWRDAFGRIAKTNPQGNRLAGTPSSGGPAASVNQTAPAAQWSYASPPVNYGSAPQAVPADPTYLPTAPSDCPRIPASTVAGTGGVAPKAGGSLEPPATGYVPWYAQGNFVPSSRRKD